MAAQQLIMFLVIGGAIVLLFVIGMIKEICPPGYASPVCAASVISRRWNFRVDVRPAGPPCGACGRRIPALP